ncbi:MAG: magnesium transporter [Chloroflexi bacterium RBG_19FT_COMBO_56_12]|nr:MAG: magnesium transporter [Chloroflexi bacterium RBG_19FT_COMBO_56_12]
MITFFKNTENGLAVLPEPVDNCWVNVIDPSPEEQARLVAMGVPHDYIVYPLDMDERARTERENGEVLIILRIPHFLGKEADIPYITVPLGIILTPRYIITVCRQDNQISHDLISGRVRNLSTAKRYRFVLRVLLATATMYLNNLREITKAVDALEDQLQLSTRNKEVYDLLKYQKSLTFFTTALKSNELMVERLQRSRLFNQYPEDDDLLDDVITENQQAIEMTNITSNILSGMMDAFASIISNNLNTVMKFLASVTIIINLPVLFSSFYGMNVNLPIMSHPMAFWIIVSISVIVTFGVGYIFAKRDWM